MENLKNFKAMAFFDLDGTLLNAESKVDPEVAGALAELRRNDVLPLIATGRGHFELSQIMADSGITGAIAMNGQYIILDGEVVYKEAIPVQSIENLLTAVHRRDEALAFYDSSHYWVSDLTEFALKAYEYTHQVLPSESEDFYRTNEVNMLLVLTDKLSRVELYKSEVPELNYFKNSPFSIDVTNASTNKGTGIEHVKQLLGFDGPTYGFGDGRNDLHLLEACDYGTAMGNAVPELKEVADFISSANTNHGIVNAFKHWGLI